MTILTIAICKEKNEDANRLKEQLRHILPTAEIQILRSGEKLLKILRENEHAYNLVFLGLEEPGLAGLKIAEKIRKKDIFVPIIFISNSDAYYREAFGVFALQYLRRPYTEEELRDALYPLILESKSDTSRIVHFRSRSQLYSIRHNRITYISSNLHNVLFHLENGKILVCRGKLQDFDEQLKGSSFLRCHQSFYVNVEKVIAMKSDSFLLMNGAVPISRSYAKAAKQYYEDYVQKNGI